MTLKSLIDRIKVRLHKFVVLLSPKSQKKSSAREGGKLEQQDEGCALKKNENDRLSKDESDGEGIDVKDASTKGRDVDITIDCVPYVETQEADEPHESTVSDEQGNCAEVDEQPADSDGSSSPADNSLAVHSKCSEVNDEEHKQANNTSSDNESISTPAPKNIDGRRHRETTGAKTRTQTKPKVSKPELICRQVHGSPTWEVILRAFDGFQLSSVVLDGEELDHDEKECLVPTYKGRLHVEYSDNKRHEVSLFENEPLIFKLQKKWKGTGQLTAKLTRGYFIVLTPESWQRRGKVPIEHEGCTDSNFSAHHFYIGSNATEEDLNGFSEWEGSLNGTSIVLTGGFLYDDDSDECPLFVGDSPNLKPQSEVVWARVGDEGVDGWSENFLPNEKSLSEILNGREGHFFLRVYDEGGTKLDSVEFRHIKRNFTT